MGEFGYLPFEPAAAHLLFQLVSRRYERGSILITSNRAVGDWGTVLGDQVVATAILDRLLHHSHVLTIRGDSYRLREKRRSGLNRAGFVAGFNPWKDGAMSKPTANRFSPEVRSCAVRMVFDYQAEHPSQWAAINSIAGKIGCTGETLRNWVRQVERDQGVRGGPTTEDSAKIKALERENRELRQANEILRKASAYFAQAELDRPLKR